MRVLFLRRQRFGGTATYTQLLVPALDSLGIEAVVDDVEEWIPNQTGPKIDREVSKIVRDAAKGFDLVHAFGYRTAWACAAAFGREKWLYTAHDVPKSTHPRLIENLNLARAGVCSSQAVHGALWEADAKRLHVVLPGLPSNRRVLDKKESRAILGVQDDIFLLACAGRFCTEHSLQTPIYVTDALPYNARLLVCGEGELEQDLRDIAKERVTFSTERFTNQTAIAAADAVIVPSTVAGFSFTAIEAMFAGTPPVMRRTGGLTEIAEDHRTGFYFDTDEELLDLLNHLCYKRELLAEVGREARQRALQEFDIGRSAEQLAQVYRSVLA